MPIWRTSELWTGRPGSPSRKVTSARSSSSQSSSSRSTSLPLLRHAITEESAAAADEQPETSTGSSCATSNNPEVRAPESVFSGSNSYSNLDAFQSPAGGPAAVGAATGAPHGSLRSPLCSTPRSDARSGSCGPFVRTQTYTLQYIGIANGELGILSQKQKMMPPVTVTGATGPASVDRVVTTRRQSRASGTSAPASRVASARATILEVATSGAVEVAAGSTCESRPAVAAAARPPRPHSRRTSSARPAPSSCHPTPHDTGPTACSLDGAVSAAAAVAAVAGIEALSDASPDDHSTPCDQVQPTPSFTHIVDDAYGRVKVITECFYSRGLQSRAAPHDRHTRRNRLIGPQVKDMEPLSTAMPGCFGNRAPSAGGFPGWKLTISGASASSSSCPRQTYSGSDPWVSAGSERKQRVASAQTLAAVGPGALSAAAAAVAQAAAATVISSSTSATGHRTTAWAGPGFGSET